jgi:CMP-N-acetylneuraminic acid synthetase
MHQPTCLGVITARGGSKGVHKKNIRPLVGKELLRYTADVAVQCPFLTRTVIATDSEEIRAVALDSGVEAPFLLPAELTTDTAKQEASILYVMRWYEQNGGPFDLVCLLEPTTPLRRVETLNAGFQLLLSRPDADALFSVAECDFSPLSCNTLRSDGTMREWMDVRYKLLNRQEKPKFYRPVGVVILARWQSFVTELTFMHDKTLTMVVDPVEARDIDTPFDFFVVESLLQKGLRHSEAVKAFLGS